MSWPFPLQSKKPRRAGAESKRFAMQKLSWIYSDKRTLCLSRLCSTHSHNISIYKPEEVVELSMSSQKYNKPLQCANTLNIAKLDVLLWSPVRCLVRPTSWQGFCSCIYSDCKRVRKYYGWTWSVLHLSYFNTGFALCCNWGLHFLLTRAELVVWLVFSVG